MNDADARFCKSCGTAWSARNDAQVARRHDVREPAAGAPGVSRRPGRDAESQRDVRAVLPVTDRPGRHGHRARRARWAGATDLTKQAVEFTVDGKRRDATTDANGRAELSGLRAGTRVRAVAVVDGERLESQKPSSRTAACASCWSRPIPRP